MAGIHTSVAQNTFALVIYKEFIRIIHTGVVHRSLIARGLNAIFEAVLLKFTIAVSLTGETVCTVVGKQKI